MLNAKDKTLAEIATLKQVLKYFDEYGIKETAIARAVVVGMIDGKEKFMDAMESGDVKD